MKVIVDTPIWSYALRSKHKGYENHIEEFVNLISDQRVLILGPITQEVLSGYSVKKKFGTLEEKLKYFENTPIIDEDYVTAAKFSNKCRCKGIQGSHIDFLICSVASRLGSVIFTTDKDFLYYKKNLPIELLELR
ncbi:MAG: PIN domain-containing protein [Thiohalomonadales bacterium]